jgi:hypothetical protein
MFLAAMLPKSIMSNLQSHLDVDDNVSNTLKYNDLPLVYSEFQFTRLKMCPLILDDFQLPTFHEYILPDNLKPISADALALALSSKSGKLTVF